MNIKKFNKDNKINHRFIWIGIIISAIGLIIPFALFLLEERPSVYKMLTTACISCLLLIFSILGYIPNKKQILSKLLLPFIVLIICYIVVFLYVYNACYVEPLKYAYQNQFIPYQQEFNKHISEHNIIRSDDDPFHPHIAYYKDNQLLGWEYHPGGEENARTCYFTVDSNQGQGVNDSDANIQLTKLVEKDNEHYTEFTNLDYLYVYNFKDNTQMKYDRHTGEEGALMSFNEKESEKISRFSCNPWHSGVDIDDYMHKMSGWKIVNEDALWL